jgi:hypothetical protein
MIGGNKMYICLNCRTIFSKPDRWEERHGFDYGPFEQWSGCPHCGDGYVELPRCDCCGEYIEGTYIRIENGDRICEHCYTVYEIGDEN